MSSSASHAWTLGPKTVSDLCKGCGTSRRWSFTGGSQSLGGVGLEVFNLAAQAWGVLRPSTHRKSQASAQKRLGQKDPCALLASQPRWIYVDSSRLFNERSCFKKRSLGRYRKITKSACGLYMNIHERTCVFTTHMNAFTHVHTKQKGLVLTHSGAA